MKKTNQPTKRSVPGALQDRYLKRLLLRPIVKEVKQQKKECLEIGKIILKKLKVQEALLDIIARHLQRQAKGSE